MIISQTVERNWRRHVSRHVSLVHRPVHIKLPLSKNQGSLRLRLLLQPASLNRRQTCSTGPQSHKPKNSSYYWSARPRSSLAIPAPKQTQVWGTPVHCSQLVIAGCSTVPVPVMLPARQSMLCSSSTHNATPSGWDRAGLWNGTKTVNHTYHRHQHASVGAAQDRHALPWTCVLTPQHLAFSSGMCALVCTSPLPSRHRPQDAHTACAQHNSRHVLTLKTP